MKKIATIILLMSVGFSCSKEDRLTEFAISGDSELRVNNDTNDKCLIYFDNNYIGTMRTNTNRTWKVPSGIHVFKAMTDEYADFVQTDTFPKNGYRTIRLYIKSQTGEIKSIEF